MRKRAQARFLFFKRCNKKLVKKHKKKQKARNSITAGKFISDIVSLVRDLAEPVCESEGMELIHVEYGPEKGGKTLRLYIDKPGGITLDDCAAISHQVGDILDINLEDSGSYNLEVSSPGPERQLAKIDDFKRFEGNIIKSGGLISLTKLTDFTKLVIRKVVDEVETEVVLEEKIGIILTERGYNQAISELKNKFKELRERI